MLELHCWKLMMGKLKEAPWNINFNMCFISGHFIFRTNHIKSDTTNQLCDNFTWASPYILTSSFFWFWCSFPSFVSIVTGWCEDWLPFRAGQYWLSHAHLSSNSLWRKMKCISPNICLTVLNKVNIQNVQDLDVFWCFGCFYGKCFTTFSIFVHSAKTVTYTIHIDKVELWQM